MQCSCYLYKYVYVTLILKDKFIIILKLNNDDTLKIINFPYFDILLDILIIGINRVLLYLYILFN